MVQHRCFNNMQNVCKMREIFEIQDIFKMQEKAFKIQNVFKMHEEIFKMQ